MKAIIFSLLVALQFNSVKTFTAPTFPGGAEAMVTFIQENLSYPITAREEGIEGTVKVRFTVDENGRIEDVCVTEGIDRSCNEAAVKVIKTMPDWTPAEKDGTFVESTVILSIKFTLTLQ